MILKKITKEQDKILCQVVDTLLAEGLSQQTVEAFWQTPMYQLNGHTPMDALAEDKIDLVKRAMGSFIEDIHNASKVSS
jgi:hypothetical protein